MLHRAARNAYSWWWASHIRTKQSKWLEQNLQDMEEKVEYILKIIEEDGDSFAQRAEMYYRKRPEIVNFAEDSFRGYRALAERYDKLSRELQSANRTIATVYPEQVQLAMDEEDEENFPTTSTPSRDPKKRAKNLPAVPKLNIPKSTKTPQKNSNAPARLMSKKGLLKISVPTTAAAITSRMSKAEALGEIDKLQKNILGLQTEKEFVKSSYESGLAKYWEIDEQVTEMQAKINILQDELGIGTFIEDDEARTLMAATALKSCQETLIRLQEKQQQSDKEARMEYQRVKEVYEKLEILKENLGNNTNRKDLPKKPEFVSTSTELKDVDQEVHSMERERRDLELLRAKIKEQLQVNSSASLTMSELAEKIDDLVDNVITLETAMSLQNALVKRLRSETNELQTHLRSLEGDKEVLIEGSDSKSNKIRELEQELLRIQNLNQNVKHQNRNLQVHFTEANSSIDHLSEKLQTVKQDEEFEHIVHFKELRAVPSTAQEKEFQVHEELAPPDNNSKISKDVKTEGKEKIDVLEQGASVKAEEENIAQSNPSNHLVDHSHKGQVRAVQNAKPEKQFEGNEVMMARGHDSAISKDVRMREKAKKDGIADHKTGQSDPSSHVDDLLVPVEVRDVPNANLERRFKENEDATAHGYDSVISKTVRMEVEAKKDHVPFQDSSIKAEENFVHSDLSNCLDDLFAKGQAISVPDDNLVEGLNEHKDTMGSSCDKVITKDVKMEEKEKKNDSPDHCPVKAEEENSFQFNLCNPLEDLSVNGQVRAVSSTNSEGFKEHEDLMSPTNDPVISTDVKTEKGEKKYDNQDLGASVKAEEENIVQPSPSNHFDDLPKKGQVGAPQDVVMGTGKDSMISKDTIMERKTNDSSLDYNPYRAEENFVQSNPSNQFDSLLVEVQVRAVPDANPAKGFKEHEDMVVSGNDSLVTKAVKAMKEEKKCTSVEANEEENYIQSNPSNHLNYHSSQKDQEPKKQDKDEKPGMPQRVDADLNVESQELATEDEDQPNWRQMFLDGLDDRENILLDQYVSAVRNYKEAKKKFGEIEKKNHDSLFKSVMQIRELKNANALKDAEIQSLHKKLNLLLQFCPDETPDTRESMTREATSHLSDTSSPNSDGKQVPDLLDEPKLESLERKEESTAPELAINPPRKGEEGEKRVISVDEPCPISTVQEKFRSDIDGLLEENIEFWLRFSTSFHQIQKFQTSVQDLQEELAKLREIRKQDGSSSNKHRSQNSDVRPIYKHLREIETELALWLEHNALLEDDLQNRLSSLSSIQEEISRLSNAGGGSKEEEEPDQLSDYQAAKFQGEVLNMKQENNQVAHKLLAGLECVKELQVEIARTLRNLEAELGISESKNSPQTKSSSSRSRIPLRSFLFGVRLRKQKASLFHCMSPSLQKQYSDLNNLPT